MNAKKERGKIDWMITLVPLAIVIALCVLFFFMPEQSNAVLSQIRFFFGDTFGYDFKPNLANPGPNGGSWRSNVLTARLKLI